MLKYRTKFSNCLKKVVRQAAENIKMFTSLGIVVEVGFLLGLYFHNGIHEIFMSDRRCSASQGNHSLQEHSELQRVIETVGSTS